MSTILLRIRRIIGKVLRKYPLLFKFIYLIERTAMPLIKRTVMLPIRLIKLNYLAIKEYFNKDKQNLIDREEASFMGDRFATMNYVAFLHDKKFNQAYNDALALIDSKTASKFLSNDIRWRAHIVTWAAKQAIKLDGDFVECGVWWGFLSKTICEYINFEKYTNKTFYLIDTWGDQNNKDLNHPNYQVDVFDKVSQRFSKYQNVKLIRGRIPEIFITVPVKKIAFLSIDMNGYIAERKTLETYYDIMAKGGIIYFDDYGWKYKKLRETVDDFFKDKPETLLHFPSGNSIVVKL